MTMAFRRKPVEDEDFDAGNLRPGGARAQFVRGSGPQDWQKSRQKRDGLSVALWVLDRIVIVAALLAVAAAVLVAFRELGQSGEDYDDLRSLGAVGRLFWAWMNTAWPLIALAIGAWAIARFTRAVTGRA